MLDSPRIPGRLGARGLTGQHGTEAFAAKLVACDADRIAHINKPRLEAIGGPRAGQAGGGKAYEGMHVPY